jgi:hypothetical protein
VERGGQGREIEQMRNGRRGEEGVRTTASAIEEYDPDRRISRKRSKETRRRKSEQRTQDCNLQSKKKQKFHIVLPTQTPTHNSTCCLASAAAASAAANSR